MHPLRNLIVLLGLLFAPVLYYGQCQGNPQTGGSACSGSPLVLYASNGSCSNCTFTWSGSPSGQGTPVATYNNWTVAPGSWLPNGVLTMNGYNPNASCNFQDIFSICIAGQPVAPAPTLLNGPWNGDTSKTWIYARYYSNPAYSFGSGGSVQFYPSWTVSGGTLLREGHVWGTGPFYKDTLFVKWSGASPMLIQEHQLTMYHPSLAPDLNCNWTPPSVIVPNPPLNVFSKPYCAGYPTTVYTFPYPGSSFTWTVTNGSILGGQGTNSIQVLLNGSSTLSVVRDSSGTLTTASLNVSPSNVTMNLGPDRNLCQYTSTTLNATAGFTAYTWSTGATTQAISVSAAGTYSVTGTLASGCPASDTIVLTSVPVVRPNLGPDIHACSFPQTLNAGTGYMSYSWSNASVTQTINVTTAGLYRVTATDANGCPSSDTVVVFNNVPIVQLPATSTYCVPGSQALSATTANITSYLWSTGATTPTIAVTGLGSQSIWLQGSNAYCSARDTIVVTGNPRPTVSLGPDILACTVPVALNPGPGYAGYAWSTGASSQSIGVSNSGTYRVTVTGANGCTASDTVVVNNQSVTVNLGAGGSYCVPPGLTLSPTVTNATTYLWSNGATTSSTSVSTIGPSMLSLQATNAAGCIGADTISITGVAVPTPNIGPNQTVCAGTAANFDAGPGYASYLWSNGATTQSISPTAAGTYSVTVTNAAGCTGTASAQLSVLPFSAPNLGPNLAVCQGTATLDAGAGYATYLWSTGATTQSITVSNPGNFSVTVSSANGCTASDTTQVTFSNFNFSLGPDTTLCEPHSLTLDPQLVGNYTFVWSTGATTPTVTINSAGTHTVTLIVSNNWSCIAYDTVAVNILSNASTLNLGADTSICADTSVVLDAGSGFAGYLWNTGSTSAAITISQGGLYTILVTLANGCEAADTVNVSILPDCVFPGDVDYNLAVDLMDFFTLGNSIGNSGPLRPSASLQWYGQAAPDWSGTILPGVNAKQADTDGDGAVTQLDTVAIHSNFGNTHARIGGITSGQANLRVEPVTTPIAAGSIAEFNVYFEDDAGLDLDSIHGLGMHVQWTNVGLAGPGLVAVDHSGSWFAPPGHQTPFTLAQSNDAWLATARRSFIDTVGHGLAMVLRFQTDPAIPSGSTVGFAPLVDAFWVDAGLGEHAVGVNVAPLNIVGLVGAVPATHWEVIVSPNPADAVIRLRLSGEVVPERVQLCNLVGQILIDQAAADEREVILSIQDLPAGQYFLRVQAESGLVVKKVVVAH